MSNLHIVSVRENPAYTETAIRYFQKHWASEDSTTRQELLRRNQAIYAEYAAGARMEALAEKSPLQFSLQFDGLRFALSFLSELTDRGLSLAQWQARMPAACQSVRNISIPA